MSTVIVIPARLASTRLPAKVLKLIDQKPMIQHVYERAVAAKLGDVVVATDHEDVMACVRGFSGHAVMTPSSCRTGSDRVAAALSQLTAYDQIINLQGDLPYFDPKELSKVLLPLAKGYDVATLVAPMPQHKLQDVHTVKAIISDEGAAIYRCHWFCRAALAYGAFHLGVYAYTPSALRRFAAAEQSFHEKYESLEQLRFLAMGVSMGATMVSHQVAEVNTASDYHAICQQGRVSTDDSGSQKAMELTAVE